MCIGWRRICTPPISRRPVPWNALGHESDFGQLREILVAPTTLFCMYHFKPWTLPTANPSR